jgi:hypothetical protein
LEQFASEIEAIASEAQPESIRMIYCDAAVQAVEEFGPSEPIRLSPKGGGGTKFAPPFNWVEENGIEPTCLIYLTDLCCNSFPPAPDYPVLWVTDSRKTAPFRETVRYIPFCLGLVLLRSLLVSLRSLGDSLTSSRTLTGKGICGLQGSDLLQRFWQCC